MSFIPNPLQVNPLQVNPLQVNPWPIKPAYQSINAFSIVENRQPAGQPAPMPLTLAPTKAPADSFLPALKPPVTQATQPVAANQPVKPVFVNRLKEMLRQGTAVIYAFNVRTYGAVDKNHDGFITPELGESGTFLSCISRLDELKALGVNALHILPINPPGKQNRLGRAGSIYAPGDYTTLNPEFGTPYNGLTPVQEAKILVEECHKRGIAVMMDVPSCASEDLAQAHPELIAVNEKGERLTPGNWVDIVAFKNDENLKKYYQQFFDLMANEVGVDGFRCDVARFRTDDFWQQFINQYPQKGWFAESYVEEDDSPIPNIPRDRPWDLLKDGFDTYYGQFHIFHQWSANEYLNYLTDERKRMMEKVGEPRAFTGTFYTHDDKSMMKHGGVGMYHLSSAMMALQPWTSPYILDGYLDGDPEEYDIFDYKPASHGKNPEIGQFLKEMLQLRQKLGPLVSEGDFTPIPVQTPDPVNQIIAFTRSYQGKTLLVLANHDVNASHQGTLTLPTLQAGQPLVDLVPHDGRFPKTGQSSQITAQPNALQVNLEPGAIHVFEINTPLLPRLLPTLYTHPGKALPPLSQAGLNQPSPFDLPKPPPGLPTAAAEPLQTNPKAKDYAELPV